MLLLREGEPVHLWTPKNHFKADVCLTRDSLVFGTGKTLITFQQPDNTRDPVEDETMAACWKVFKFTQQIPLKCQKGITPCQKCFSDLVLPYTCREKL